MRKIIKLSFALCSFFLLSSCFVGKLFQDTTVRRYKSAEYIKLNDIIDTVSIVNGIANSINKTDKPRAELSIFSTKISSSKSESTEKSLWDLDSNGEAKLLEILDKRSDSDKEFYQNLEKKFLKSKPKGIVKDYSTQNLKMIISISKNRRYEDLDSSYSLADRIEYLKIRMDSDSSGMHYIKWNKFQTEYGTINIGDVTFDESVSITGGIGGSRSTSQENSFNSEGDAKKYASTGSFAPSLSATGTSGIQEVQKVGYRYIALNGKINRDSLIVEQEGIRDIDLAGNIIIDVEMKFDETEKHQISSFKNLPGLDEIPKTNFFSSVNIEKTEIELPNENKLQDINLSMQYEYIYRNVKNPRGAKTFFEWDDQVRFYGQKVKKNNNVVLKPKDYMPQVYGIVAADGDLDAVMPEYFDVLSIRDTISNNSVELKALNEAEFQKFLDFINVLNSKEINKIKKLKLELSKNPNDRKLKKKILKTEEDYKRTLTIGRYELILNRGIEQSENNIRGFSLGEYDEVKSFIRVEPRYLILKKEQFYGF